MLDRDKLIVEISIISNTKNLRLNSYTTSQLENIKKLCSAGMKLSKACKIARKYEQYQINFLLTMCLSYEEIKIKNIRKELSNKINTKELTDEEVLLVYNDTYIGAVTQLESKLNKLKKIILYKIRNIFSK